MKHIISCGIVIFLLLTFAGCGGEKAPYNGGADKETDILVTDTETEEEVHEGEEPTPAPVMPIEKADLPMSFSFLSGVGGWSSDIIIMEDGTFTGQYHDSEMGASGEGYPNGTVYICDFYGKFTNPQKIDAQTYQLTLEHVTSSTPKKAWIENGVLYEPSVPYGVEEGKELTLYAPGTPLTKLPETVTSFMQMLCILEDAEKTGQTDMYILYNPTAESVFFQYTDAI